MLLKTGSTSASSRTIVQHGSNRVVQLRRPAHNDSLYCFRNLQRCRKLEGIVAASVVQHGIEVQEELQKVVQHGSESSGATAMVPSHRRAAAGGRTGRSAEYAEHRLRVQGQLGTRPAPHSMIQYVPVAASGATRWMNKIVMSR